jgi:membrane-associated phospholipid phosphatase
VLAIGFSRVYRGVHRPSDVLAGWRLDAPFALTGWTTLPWFGDRGQVAVGGV